jgi:hypothetical protein
VEKTTGCREKQFSNPARLKAALVRFPLRNKLASIRAGQLQMLEIEPLAGASIIMLAKKIEIE